MYVFDLHMQLLSLLTHEKVQVLASPVENNVLGGSFYVVPWYAF